MGKIGCARACKQEKNHVKCSKLYDIIIHALISHLMDLTGFSFLSSSVCVCAWKQYRNMRFITCGTALNWDCTKQHTVDVNSWLLFGDEKPSLTTTNHNNSNNYSKKRMVKWCVHDEMGCFKIYNYCEQIILSVSSLLNNIYTHTFINCEERLRQVEIFIDKGWLDGCLVLTAFSFIFSVSLLSSVCACTGNKP